MGSTRRFPALALGAALVVSLAVYAQSGGYPTRARFNSVGIGAAAPAGNGGLTVTTVNGIAPSDFARLSVANTFTGPALISTADPYLRLNETDGLNASYVWFEDAGVTRAFVGSVNNAGGLCGGAAVGDLCMRVESGALRWSGDAGASSVDMTPASGTFTITVNAGCTTMPSGTARFARMGQLVIAVIPSLTCTNNAAVVTMSGFPVSIRPATLSNANGIRVQVGATDEHQTAIITTAGGLQLSRPNGTVMPSSGAVGWGVFNIAYTLQ